MIAETRILSNEMYLFHRIAFCRYRMFPEHLGQMHRVVGEHLYMLFRELVVAVRVHIRWPRPCISDPIRIDVRRDGETDVGEAVEDRLCRMCSQIRGNWRWVTSSSTAARLA